MFGEWLSLVEHLVRDQGVGGSNPLSPTNVFNHLQTSGSGPPGVGPDALALEDSSILGFSPSLGRKAIYKNIYSKRNLLPLTHSAMIHVPGIG